MKVHKPYQLRLKEAEQQRDGLEAQTQKCRNKLHEALLANKHGQAEQLQQVLESLQRKLTLAEAKVEAVKGTEPKAKEEAKQAKEDLEKALPIVKTLSNQLPQEWDAFQKRLEELLTTLDEYTTAYGVLCDRRFEVTYLADLVGENITLPRQFQFDPSPLAEASHRLKNAAELTTSPNPQIRWGGKIAELQNVRNKQEKRRRREAAGDKVTADVFTVAGL